MTDPTHLFCIGATKAGTTWVHRYLATHPQCHLRGVKEMHYFDAVAFDQHAAWADDLRHQHTDAMRSAETTDNPFKQMEKLRLAQDVVEWAEVLGKGGRDDAAYLRYLDSGRATDARLVADITPAYALLPAAWLAQMARIRADVRFLYLLRDPVARIWSHIRMIAKRRATDKNDAAEVQMRAVNVANRVLNGQESEILARSDYAGTLARLAEAVPCERLHVAVHEEMFNETAIARICGFLGLDPSPARLDRKVMRGPAATMAPGQDNKLRALLAPQYAAVADWFGRPPAAWAHQTESVG